VTISNHIDPVRIGEELLYRVLHGVFHHEPARQQFLFSQINGFCDNEGMPGWNIWLDNDNGANQVLLLDAQVQETNQTARRFQQVAGRFAIHFFPDMTMPSLAHYSDEEVQIRRGPLFDHTGTPTPHGRQVIDGHLFLAGFLDFNIDTARHYLELSCTAPNRWRDVDLQADDSCRNIPGWKHAVRLFDKLVAAFCHVHQTSPEFVILAKKNWMRFHIANGAEPDPRPDPDIDLIKMVVGLRLHPHDANDNAIPGRDSLIQRLKADGFEDLQTIRPDSGHECSHWWAIKGNPALSFHDHEPALCRCYQDH